MEEGELLYRNLSVGEAFATGSISCDAVSRRELTAKPHQTLEKKGLWGKGRGWKKRIEERPLQSP